jgi:hypothetical protein
MIHTIVFAIDRLIDLERAPGQALERVQLRAGTPVRVEIRPYVIEGPGGPMEVADLVFEDGTATRQVPFASFSFAE